MNTASASAAPWGGVFTPLRRAESWLDARGRPAWIAAMVLGFVLVWPLGLMILGYMIYARKFRKFRNPEDAQMFCRHRRHEGFSPRSAAWRGTGNSAFDAYKAETLKRLEDEQEAFESFLRRLRDAKDKQEFDRFMDERAKSAPAAAAGEGLPAAPAETV